MLFVFPFFAQSSQEIGESAFEGSNLQTIVFQDDDAHPSALSTIGKNAFKACESLGEVTFPSMVQNISEGAFQGCISLGELEIPNSVTKLPHKFKPSSRILQKKSETTPDFSYKLITAPNDATAFKTSQDGPG